MIEVQPLGVVRSPIKESSRDIPWGGIVSTIELDPSILDPAATEGLEEFSHVQVIFHLDRVPVEEIEHGKRHPKNRTDWPEVGILAQRARRRPNRIGVTTCKLLKVQGLKLTVMELDAIDGTPVIDVKPYLEEFGPRSEVRQPKWSRELMATYF